MDFEATLKHYRERTEKAIDRLIPSANTRPSRLHEAMRHSLKAGGKRLRPALLFAANDLEGSPLDPEPAAVALEALHTYSLIHDDLPCMDNSDLRRGQPTCHRRFDEATALLAGDALLTEAFGLLARHYTAAPEVATALAADLADTAGSRKLIAGQVEDLAGATQPDPERLTFIQLNKTAALLSTALTMGVRLGGARPDQMKTVRDLGRNLGQAFQIMDDILDATSDEETLGKSTGVDAQNETLTHPGLHGLEAAREAAAQHTRAAQEAAGRLQGDPAFIIALIQSLEHRIR